MGLDLLDLQLDLRNSLICGGALDAYPTLKTYISHAGGMAVFQLGRLSDLNRVMAPDARNQRPLMDYMKNFYFDLDVHHPALRRAVVEVVGADNLLYGTNFGGAYDYAGGGAAPPPPSGNVVSPHNHHHQLPTNCLNPAADVNSRLDTQVEVRVYPCNNNNNNSGAAAHLQKKKFTQFHVKPEGVIIQGTNRRSAAQGGGGGMGAVDLGAEYAAHVGRRLQRYELSDTRACQLLVTTHGKSFWVVPAPEAFSRHSGTCRLLGDRKHPAASHGLQVGDFLRVGSVGVVVIETHDGSENRVLSEEKIQKIMKDTTNNSGGFDLADTDGGE